MADDDDLIPDSGAVFTFGRSRFADNIANKFWIKNDPVLCVACGDEHSAVLTERGRVYVFGSNEWGQLGLGHLKPLNKPSFIKALKPEKVTLLACGRSHTLVYSESQKLFSFGSNGDGQLGHGDKEDLHAPKEIIALSDIVLKNISCGAYHSAALTENGEVYVWGVNSDGQLGLGEDVEESTTPTKLTLKEPIISLSCGYYHTALVTQSGLIFAFGENENGKLGLSDSQCDDTSFPQQVEKLEADKYTSVSCGARHTVAITDKGCCYSWGDGSHGQLGHGTMQLEVPLPRRIDYLNGLKVIYVSSGDGHTAVIADNGMIYTFGDGRHGKLGQGDECFSNLFKPTVITRFNGFEVKFVDCGGCHMLVGAILKSEVCNDMIDGKITVEDDNTLNASMCSNKSIPDANMTLKPGSITYPLVSARDKRRHKKDDLLNNSLNLNSSLNSSLNMAQLSRTVVQLPTVLDRNRLPKIPGVKQITINNYSRKESSKIDADISIKEKIEKEVEDDVNATCSKGILDEDVREQNEITKNSKKESQKKPIDVKSDEDKYSSGGASDENKGSFKTKTNKDIVSKSTLLKESKKDEESEDSELENDIEGKRKKKGKSKVLSPMKVNSKHVPSKRSKKDKHSDEEEEEVESVEDESEDEEKRYKIAKQKNKATVQKNKVDKSPIKKSKKAKESEEEDDDDVSDKEKKEIKNEGKILVVAQKSKTVQKKSKKVEESEDDEEEEDDEDEEADDDDYDEDETEEEEEEEEEEEISDEEDSGNEEDSPVEHKKTRKMKKENEAKHDGKKKNKDKDICKSKEGKGNKAGEYSSKKSLQKKKTEKKTTGKKSKAKKEEDKDDDDDDDEEEEEDVEEDEEEDDEEEDEDEVDEDDDSNEEVDGKKGSSKKSKKVKANENDKKPNAEETKTETNNRSGFLSFFRRNKKPQVDVEPSSSKSPEKSVSPSGDGTNRNQSKTCTLL